MAQIKVIHDPSGETLTIYRDDPEHEEMCEEIGKVSCDGQVKSDTALSRAGQSLEVIGTNIPQLRMQPLVVV